jgi:hypothetical protein
MNLAQITLGMVDRPATALAAAAARPRSWWLPAVLLVLTTLLLLWIAAPIRTKTANELSAQMIERITASMAEEQAKQVLDAARPVTEVQLILTGGATLLLSMGLGWVLRGTVAHFSSIAAGGQSVWGNTFAACLWSTLPFVFRNLLQSAYILAMKQDIAHEGLALLVSSGEAMKDGTNLLYAALANADLFALWHIILFGLAIAAATKVGRGKGMVMALIIWLVFAAVKLVPVAVGAAFTGRFMG